MPKLLLEVSTRKSPRTGNRKSQPLIFNGVDFLYHHWAKNQIEKLMKSEPIGMPHIKKPATANQDRAASIKKIIESISCIIFIEVATAFFFAEVDKSFATPHKCNCLCNKVHMENDSVVADDSCSTLLFLMALIAVPLLELTVI